MSDVLVVGGGLVGAATTYGLLREGLSVTMLDEGDIAFRASRGNFGLVWVQSKGDGRPEYAQWTRRSADLWPGLQDALGEETGINTHYEKPGGLHFSLSEEDFEKRCALIHRMHNVHGAAHYGAEILDAKQVRELVPGLGPDVVGGTYCKHDGHASPLYLLRALHTAIEKRGGKIVPNASVSAVAPDGNGFRAETAKGTMRGDKLVLAAGLGNRKLGGGVGLDVPVAPEKGQILVTERARPLLPMPTHVVRQTSEGTFMIGDSHEDVGFNLTSTTPTMSMIAARAVKMFPFLKDLRLVRSWAALRVMAPDGYPIYEESAAHPGAFTVNCHSGVTLAAAHALGLAPMIAKGQIGDELSVFTAGRFDANAH
ncbi:FAD-binding oxidoreductase [Acuticoccus sp. M5D2P5]|uniref:NAD(P)/FAD-dependent oxidoreductase n=1 Tax=Acuticoccus kalidii TaxID=2910977 RepID=UPI001F3206B4|nr:FAD-dependent oxidoreductase [Acuticoccus kalidii]MCF3935205.1 FAD-binding oxidoreductase [Acuticoccus kalidii]